ncbi:hydrogenase nickel incorporation protein HypB [Pseudaquidulcibacter saccharophilus]|uniref:hydrogenase nickel incorporation protein HypB n=1 Tax=Pseudaquidulcibacter saccharophilus TaxID=2831900 RepID=UPI001EFF35E8|nr:hydrogenase nickel incorporation protein HypB [Pseudaquidulcibacter saccharophilus]
MCNTCGCASGNLKIEGDEHHHHHHDHDHDHEHEHDHHHEHNHDIDYNKLPARNHNPGMSQARMIEIEENILAKNDAYAAQNRELFKAKGILALNLVSSPGSGKTSLLVETIKALQEKFQVSVIEGDQQTTNDADRIRETGVKAIQVNTGKGCHLDGHMVGHAVEHLTPEDGSILFIENVGNLVCPAAFDLGEAAKIAVLSVTEGEDKPLKYPDMFAASKIMILNKIDLLPHLDFDVDACINNAKRINPEIKVIQVSAKTREGFDEWLGLLESLRGQIITEILAEQEEKLNKFKNLLK